MVMYKLHSMRESIWLFALRLAGAGHQQEQRTLDESLQLGGEVRPRNPVAG